MKLTAIMLLIWVVLQAAPSDAETLLRHAETAYSNRRFQEAVDAYEQFVDMSILRGEVYFNLGNAYFQLGHYGKAMVNYLRAQQFFPRDSDLQLNIARVRAQRVDDVGQDKGLLESVAGSMKASVSRMELLLIVLAIWWLACCSFILLKRFPFKPLLRPVFILLCVTFLGLLGVTTISFGVESLHPLVVIVAKETQGYTGPGYDYLPLFKLYEADEVRLIGREGQWSRIQLADLREVWIASGTGEVVRNG